MSKELSQRADLALSNLTADGGLLDAEQNDTFIRKLIDQPTLLNAVRTVPMNTPDAKINKIGFGSRILKAASQGSSPFAADDGTNDRYLAAADRSKPTTEQLSMSTQEVIAEIRIPYEVFEDNIERDNLEDTILALIAERAALDLEELFILGDTASGDAYLALHDGILKRITTNVVDAASGTIDAPKFNALRKAVPTRYRRNINAYRYFSHPDIESDYRLAVSQRGTDLGDAVLTGNQPLPVLGSRLEGVALMPSANLVFTDPQNLIFGVQRNVRIEQDRDIRSREVIIVLTARVAIQIEEEAACSKLINLTSA
jgi:HK97 family phage major capsid protein